ncbi:MAG: VanW family protein [Candidatus Komeilibacteria bacterium]|nr:VanW family protein [Candidatus Komeilibacteria bacterium]
MSKPKLKSNHMMKWLLIVTTTFLLLLTLGLAAAFAMQEIYQDEFLPNMSVAGVQLDGLDTATAKAQLQTAVDDFKAKGLDYQYQDKIINIPITVYSTTLETSYNLVNFDVDATIDRLWDVGHRQGYTKNFYQQLKHLLTGESYYLDGAVNSAQLESALRVNFSGFETVGYNARPVMNESEITVEPHTLGMVFNYEKIMQQTAVQSAHLARAPIEIEREIDYPEVKAEDISEEIITMTNEFWQTDKKLKLFYEKSEWSVEPETYKEWLMYARTDEVVTLSFSPTRLREYLSSEVAPNIDQAPLDAKFAINNGKVTEFQSSRDGLQLDLEQSVSAANSSFFDKPDEDIELVVSVQKAKITIADVNNLGIKEIIGVGTSDFTGSPPNRVHNIKVGAAAVNGTLIAPGDTFSLIDTLGSIDAANGYLPELVIKGNRTVPEYGGGLCQIGTTTFRAAIDSGLPIVERKNHSYRVAYYEPAGFDATIYDPKPDFRFRNDTGHNIVIQARAEGTKLIFEVWGTKDGRQVEYTAPTIYNITSPGPAKIIYTTDLAPGVKKCVESAHAGADAFFDYKVTYADGQIMKERFTSHYVPWPAVCMVGISPEPEPPADPPAAEDSEITEPEIN